MVKSPVRKTLAKQIEQEGDIKKAITLAGEGRAITNLERLCSAFFGLKRVLMGIPWKNPHELHTSYGMQLLVRYGTEISEEILMALLKNDSDSFQTVAKAVEESRGGFGAPIDSKRSRILFIKMMLGNGKMTIGELAARLRGRDITVQDLAALLRYGKPSAKMLHSTFLGKSPVSTSASSSSVDGHAALRRLAKELKFPIAPERRGRRKVIQTRSGPLKPSKS